MADQIVTGLPDRHLGLDIQDVNFVLLSMKLKCVLSKITHVVQHHSPAMTHPTTVFLDAPFSSIQPRSNFVARASVFMARTNAFEDLQSEIHIQIMLDLEDPKNLYNPIRASPRLLVYIQCQQSACPPNYRASMFPCFRQAGRSECCKGIRTVLFNTSRRCYQAFKCTHRREAGSTGVIYICRAVRGFVQIAQSDRPFHQRLRCQHPANSGTARRTNSNEVLKRYTPPIQSESQSDGVRKTAACLLSV